METDKTTKPEPFLAEMDLPRNTRGLRVRIYAPPPEQSADDPGRFIVRDLAGNEITDLSLDERALAQTLVFGKPDAQTYYKLGLRERNGIKRAPSSSRRTSRPY